MIDTPYLLTNERWLDLTERGRGGAIFGHKIVQCTVFVEGVHFTIRLRARMRMYLFNCGSSNGRAFLAQELLTHRIRPLGMMCSNL